MGIITAAAHLRNAVPYPVLKISRNGHPVFARNALYLIIYAIMPAKTSDILCLLAKYSLQNKLKSKPGAHNLMILSRIQILDVDIVMNQPKVKSLESCQNNNPSLFLG
jgi:hypothetical protein